MVQLSTDALVKELIDRLEDYKYDPEPMHDGFIKSLSTAEREHLLHQLKLGLITYKNYLVKLYD